MRGLKRFSGLVSVLIALLAPSALAAQPATTNYQLNSYGFGSGGTANSGTSNYSLEGITGEVGGQNTSTTNFTAKPGFVETQQANVPKITLTNPSNNYDKLKFVIDQQNNPTDTKYALQVSTTSNFSSNITYVKSDLTLGASLATADYQTYTVWGGASGGNIIGLASNTTYYIRAKATQGQFTESGYGPSSSATTAGQQITFCTYSSGGSGVCGGSNAVSFPNLLANTVTNSSQNINVTFDTNANSGGNVYIYSSNGALKSTSFPGSPITSASGNLSSASQGYGAQIASVSQLTKMPPYDQGGNTVGILSTNVNTILTSSVPVAAGTATIQLQAKPSQTSPSAADYADILTLIAAASF